MSSHCTSSAVSRSFFFKKNIWENESYGQARNWLRCILQTGAIAAAIRSPSATRRNCINHRLRFRRPESELQLFLPAESISSVLRQKTSTFLTWDNRFGLKKNLTVNFQSTVDFYRKSLMDFVFNSSIERPKGIFTASAIDSKGRSPFFRTFQHSWNANSFTGTHSTQPYSQHKYANRSLSTRIESVLKSMYVALTKTSWSAARADPGLLN